MEDDKKKKRNKKKKNKQNNKRVDDALASGATTSVDENHIGDGDVPQISGGPDADESQSSHQIDVVATEDDSGVENKSQGSEVLLEETIKQLREENGSYLQKEEKLEERLVQYKNKNDMLLREMSSTEAQMRQLLDERSTFTQKEASLEKKVQQLQHDEESLVAEEKSSREMISSLNNEIARLRAQVTELEKSKSNLLEQNQSLKETISNLQVQHENHDSNAKGASEEELNSQIEAACTLVEKLITENADLVEKVNELCIKLNQSQHASPESLAIEVEKSESLEEIPIHDELIRIDNSRDMDTASIKRNFSEGEIEETVPLSLNANGEVDVESQVAVAGEDEINAGVPLADAPLIGAPFRLVSFVARYVSGADLAAKK
uniref:Uncharacterized protein At2g38580 n=1 Tax=Arabidopsis thaliana TaxID=3702 RepID=Q9ZVI0_ARATH|nr:hypothetical protein [Arabidopsis thaliana]